MTLAFWCVLIAALLPFPFALLAKWSKRFDNARPRDYFETLDGWRKRAHWAQLNTFESFPPFAAAVIINRIVLGPNAWADTLALAFVACRIAYGLLYLADRPTLRSLLWGAGMACTVLLFVAAAAKSVI
jgi:uncharacterized MAPEG superfamily protein